MKYKTTVGKEIEINAISITNKDAWVALRRLQDAFVDDPSEEETEKITDAFVGLCKCAGVPADAIGYGDILNVVSILQVGDTPKNSPTPQ